MEAMALGTPVIASAGGGPAEVVEDGVSGVLVPPGDVEALAEAVRRVLADRGLRARLVDGGRRRAEQYSTDAAADDILSFLLREEQ